MISVDIPGFGALRLAHLVVDFNGTLAENGVMLPGVPDLLRDLSSVLAIHVVTADTFGSAARQLAGLPVNLEVLGADGQGPAKRAYVIGLSADSVVAIGNGRNDEAMLKTAALGIALIQGEGAATATINAATAVCPGIVAALEMLKYPVRLTATLRA